MMLNPSPLKVVISGGGTGGHIFPALAIADGIKKLVPDAAILFIGAKGRMEMQKVVEAGYPIKGLWISGLQRKMTVSNLLFPIKLTYSILHAAHILKKFNPHVVIGVGGYASGPTLQAAVYLKIPTLIQEQNSFPGITNRLLGKKAHKVCVAYEKMNNWFPEHKTILTGNPMRKAAIAIEGKREAALSFFGLNNSQAVVLIIGGSQGARAINIAVAHQLQQFSKQGLQLIWQTGETFHPIALEAIKAQQLSMIVAVPFIQRMDMAYAAADIIVSRAGAMSISEISMVAKPAIFVPLPTAAEDHQTKNAQRLVNQQAALMVPNKHAEKELIPAIIELASDKVLQQQLSSNIRQFAMPNATDFIVHEILKLSNYEVR